MTSISSLRLAILCLLSQAPRSGYDFKRIFESTPMGHFSASPGAIYPALKSMENGGWIQAETELERESRPVRTLRLTAKGRDELRMLCLQPLTRDDLLFRGDQLMLRFAFMTPLVGRPATCEFLRQKICLLETHVESLHVAAKAFRNDPLEGVLALQQGIDSFETDLKWARNALVALTSKIRDNHEC